jgi:hypothetical protein
VTRVSGGMVGREKRVRDMRKVRMLRVLCCSTHGVDDYITHGLQDKADTTC